MKRYLLVDDRGVPLSHIMTGPNRHDVTRIEFVLEEIIIEQPRNVQQHLCVDKACDGRPVL